MWITDNDGGRAEHETTRRTCNTDRTRTGNVYSFTD
jgi:hypothetical protein